MKIILKFRFLESLKCDSSVTIDTKNLKTSCAKKLQKNNRFLEFYPLNANPTKWTNTFKISVDKSR